MHEKYLKSILPTFKPGGSEHYQGFKSFKIHKDDRLMMDSLVQHQDKDTDEVGIIKRIDGSFELMNELQFTQLMRGRGGTTRDIELIQSFVRPKRQGDCMLMTKFIKGDPIANKNLYDKASN